MPRNVLITGGCGYLGGAVLRRMCARRDDFGEIVVADIRIPSAQDRVKDVRYVIADVRASVLTELFTSHRPQSVIHLASIATPAKDSTREAEYTVDVQGTEKVVKACLATGVEQLVVASSGAAYGCHADNPTWLKESDAVRGNKAFSYAHHKRLVEEMLTRYREERTELRQLIFRTCTVLGARTRNQVTALFEKRFVLGVTGADTPFVFIWDEDAAEAIVRGTVDDREGVYNLAGDGAVSMAELARILDKRYVRVPPGLLVATLSVLKGLGLTRYGPEQVDFLRYRPALDNTRLKKEFGFAPTKTSREVFEYYVRENLQKR